MTAHKNERWFFYKDAVAESGGEGVTKRVLAYSDDVMVVENTFSRAPSASSITTRTPRSPTLKAVRLSLPSTAKSTSSAKAILY